MFRFHLDRLKTKEKIGKGRSGSVFPYQKDSQDLKWVVKRIKAEDLDALLKSLPEIILGFACDHPRVVPVKGYFIEQEPNGESFNIYIKLPRMKETLLTNFQNRKGANKPYCQEEILRHFYSLASGLEYLHNKRIYHGDIKPDNLLFDQKGTLKIADVGIAKHVEEDDGYQTITEKMGTYRYSAPEILGPQCTDIKKNALAKADVWSLGVVILELCVFDFRLFNSLDREKTGKDICEYLDRLQGKYDNSFLNLVKRTLSLDPNLRPDIGHIKDELEKNFSKVLGEDLLVLGKALPAIGTENRSESQIQLFNQHIMEMSDNFEVERKQLKEIICQLEANLSQEKLQSEEKIQILIDQNSKVQEEGSQREIVQEEKIKKLQQELNQLRNQHQQTFCSIIFKPIEANLTHNTDFLKKMNPYCSFLVGNQKYASQVCKHGGKRPHWNDAVTVPITNESKIMADILNNNSIIGDDLIGSFMMDLSELKAQGQSSRWYCLYYNNKPAGEILLEVQCEVFF